MELRINEIKIPERITFNFEELKTELTDKVKMYETLVHSDEQIKQAKTDKANLNKLKKALNDERISREKEYMKPFNEFKSQVNEIISIIDNPIAVIDKQIKGYEDVKKQEKADEITNYFNSVNHPEWLHLSQIFDDKWLNASTSMKSIQDTITERISKINSDLATLVQIPDFGFEASEVYKSTLDVNRAFGEAKRMSDIAKAKKETAERLEQLKAQEEIKKAEEFEKAINPPVELQPVTQATPAMWVNFSALMTVDEAKELKKFFEDRQIEFKAI